MKLRAHTLTADVSAHFEGKLSKSALTTVYVNVRPDASLLRELTHIYIPLFWPSNCALCESRSRPQLEPYRSQTQCLGTKSIRYDMSARKGDSTKRGQRHQNSSAYKAHLHGCPKRKTEALSVAVSGVCGRCKEKVEWRKKYDKYKPLTVPRKWYIFTIDILCICCMHKSFIGNKKENAHA